MDGLSSGLQQVPGVFFVPKKKASITAFLAVWKCPSPDKFHANGEGGMFLGIRSAVQPFQRHENNSRFGWTEDRQAARLLFFLMPV